MTFLIKIVEAYVLELLMGMWEHRTRQKYSIFIDKLFSSAKQLDGFCFVSSLLIFAVHWDGASYLIIEK